MRCLHQPCVAGGNLRILVQSHALLAAQCATRLVLHACEPAASGHNGPAPGFGGKGDYILNAFELERDLACRSRLMTKKVYHHDPSKGSDSSETVHLRVTCDLRKSHIPPFEHGTWIGCLGCPSLSLCQGWLGAAAALRGK